MCEGSERKRRIKREEGRYVVAAVAQLTIQQGEARMDGGTSHGGGKGAQRNALALRLTSCTLLHRTECLEETLHDSETGPFQQCPSLNMRRCRLGITPKCKQTPRRTQTKIHFDAHLLALTAECRCTATRIRPEITCIREGRKGIVACPSIEQKSNHSQLPSR